MAREIPIIGETDSGTDGAGIKNWPVSCVIIDAYAGYNIDEAYVACENIQKFLNSGLVNEIYEYSRQDSGLKHNGEKFQLAFENKNYSYTEPNLCLIPENSLKNEIILTGGCFDGFLFNSFVSLLKRIEKTTGKISIPFDCVYRTESHYDSGESWYDARLICFGDSFIERYDEKAGELGLEKRVKFFSEWKDVVDFLANEAGK